MSAPCKITQAYTRVLYRLGCISAAQQAGTLTQDVLKDHSDAIAAYAWELAMAAEEARRQKKQITAFGKRITALEAAS